MSGFSFLTSWVDWAELLDTALELWEQGTVQAATLNTLSAASLSLVLSAALGLLWGVLVGLTTGLKRTREQRAVGLKPTHVLCYATSLFAILSRWIWRGILSLPPVAWVSLIVILAGLGYRAVVIINVLTIAPVIAEQMDYALRGLAGGYSKHSRAYHELQTMEACWHNVHFLDTLRIVLYPAIKDALMTTLPLAAHLTWRSTVMGEFLASAQGIGYYLAWAKQNLAMEVVVIWAVWLWAMGTVVETVARRGLNFVVKGLGILLRHLVPKFAKATESPHWLSSSSSSRPRSFPLPFFAIPVPADKTTVRDGRGEIAGEGNTHSGYVWAEDYGCSGCQ